MSFRLVLKSVTLNHLERRNGVILRYFNEFDSFGGALRKSSRSLSHLLMNSCYHRDVMLARYIPWSRVLLSVCHKPEFYQNGYTYHHCNATRWRTAIATDLGDIPLGTPRRGLQMQMGR